MIFKHTNQQTREKNHAFISQRERAWKYWSKHKQTYKIGIRLCIKQPNCKFLNVCTHFHSLAKGFIKLLTCINKTYLQQFFNRERHISTELTNPLANSKCVIYRTMVFRWHWIEKMEKNSIDDQPFTSSSS